MVSLHNRRNPQSDFKNINGLYGIKIGSEFSGTRLYDLLHKKSRTASEIAQKLEYETKVYDFLDALLSMSYLKREGNGPTALYQHGIKREVPRSVKRTLHWRMLIMSSRRLYKYWHHLKKHYKQAKLKVK